MAIQLQINGHIAVITIDAPGALNALTISDLIHLRKALSTCQDDDLVRAIVLTGTGKEAFCTGTQFKVPLAPVTSFASSSLKSREAEAEEGGYTRLLDLCDLEIWKPVIAAINGDCLGPGLELALQCDLRIGVRGALFALPEVRMATLPTGGGVQYLLRAVSAAHAMKMVLTGESIGTEQALAIGLISDALERDQLMPYALRLAESIATNGPLAVQAIKKLATRSSHLAVRDFVAQANLHWGLLRDTADRTEANKAFAQSRPPRYTGV
jgi:E-phenylitaconyl-CoA hydratase